MRKLLNLFLFVALLTSSWTLTLNRDQGRSLPARHLAPLSYTQDLDEIIKSFITQLYIKAEQRGKNLRRPFALRIFDHSFPQHPLYHLDPDSVFVAQTHHNSLEISFRYTDLEENKQYLVDTHVEMNSNEIVYLTYKEIELRDFSTIEKDIYLYFKEGNPHQDLGASSSTKKVPRIGDHKQIILALLTDREFMQQTLDNIYGNKEFSLTPETTRPRVVEEISTLVVDEDDIGSQKQTYRVDITLIGGGILDPFAIKIGINAQNCAKFRADELDYLKKLRPSKTVPTFGAQAFVPAFDISEENKQIYDNVRDKKDRETPEGEYTVEAYSEVFVEGVTFGEGVSLVNYRSLEHYREVTLFQKLGVTRNGTITEQHRLTIKQRPKKAIENVLKGIEKAVGKKTKQTLPIRHSDYLIKHDGSNSDDFVAILRTWIEAAAYLSQETDYYKKGAIQFVKDMQRLNVMHTLVEGNNNTYFGKYRFTDDVLVGKPTIIDVGNVVEEKASVFITSLFKQYFNYFMDRSLPDMKSKNPSSFFHEGHMISFAYDFVAAFESAEYYDSDQQWLRFAMIELNQSKEDQTFLKEFMPLYQNETTRSQALDLLKVTDKASRARFWRILTLMSLRLYFEEIDQLPSQEEINELDSLHNSYLEEAV